MTLSPELQSQQAIYNEIIRRENGYPYATARWSIRALRNYFTALPNGACVFEIGANTGDSAAVLSNEVPEKQFIYTGVDISEEAIHLATLKQLADAQFVVGDGFSDELPPDVLERRSQADLIFSIYVGPSVGLRDLIQWMVSFGRPYVVLDRVYTADQPGAIPFNQMVTAIMGLIQYFRHENIPFPFYGFMKQATTKTIYADPDYQKDFELYARHAPGTLAEFNQWLLESFSEKEARIVASFGHDAVIISGNL